MDRRTDTFNRLIDELPAMLGPCTLVALSQLPQHLLSRPRTHRFVHVGDGNRTFGATTLSGPQSQPLAGNKHFGAIRSPPTETDFYSEHGVIVAKDLFERDELHRFEEVFFRRLLFQAYKMGIVDRITKPYTAEGLDRIVMAVNAKSKVALDFVVQELREVFSAAKLLTNGQLQSIFSEVLDWPPDLMKVDMDGILVNLPQNKT